MLDRQPNGSPDLVITKAILRKTSRIRVTLSKHFMEVCNDDVSPHTHMGFILIDALNNVEFLDKESIEQLLLQKEQFWIGTLRTVHSGLNTYHDWNRKIRTNIPD